MGAVCGLIAFHLMEARLLDARILILSQLLIAGLSHRNATKFKNALNNNKTLHYPAKIQAVKTAMIDYHQDNKWRGNTFPLRDGVFVPFKQQNNAISQEIDAISFKQQIQNIPIKPIKQTISKGKISG